MSRIVNVEISIRQAPKDQCPTSSTREVSNVVATDYGSV